MISAATAPELSTHWYVGTQRRRVVLLAAIAVLGSLLSAGLVLLLQIFSAAVLVTWAVLIGIAWRPRVGLYSALALNLLFDPSPDPLMLPYGYLGRSVFGSVITPMELLLLLTLTSWLLRGIARRRFDLHCGGLRWPIALFSVALAGGVIWGIVSGGSWYLGLWEVRALLAMLVCSVLAASMVRTHRDVQRLLTLFLLTISIWAVEGAYRRLVLVNSGQLEGDLVFGHEHAVYLGLAILLVLMQQAFGAPRWLRMLGPFLALICLYTLLASQRRGGLVGTMVAFIAFALVLLVSHRRAFCFLVIPLLLGGAIYFPLFWNNEGLFGQPARAIRSVIAPSARDAASNSSRELELTNVRATILAEPWRGVGFGRPMFQVVPMPSIPGFVLWDYEAHHNILWVWLKTGAIGFTLFWVLMGRSIALAANLAATLRAPELRTFAALALATIVSSLTYCYVDTGLVSSALTIPLGIVMGTLAILHRISKEGNGWGVAPALASPSPSAMDFAELRA